MHAQRETTFSRDKVGNRIYRSRGTLRVVRITKIRRRGKKGGARSPRSRVSVVLPWLTAGVEIPAISTQRRYVAVTASRRTFYLVALLEMGGGRPCRESSPFFYLSLFRNPTGGAESAVDMSRGSRVP